MLKIQSITCAVAVSLGLCQQSIATPYVIGADARPNVVGGRIATDGYDDATGTFASDVRHFGFQLGNSPANPYFTADPGFNAVVGSGLPQGQQLRFDLYRKLVHWDGAGAVRFADITTGESLRLQFGAANATATATSAFVGGYSMGNIGSGGSIHRHLNAFLEGPTTPQTGLYFTVLRLSVSSGSVTNSDATYIAYNNGLPTSDFERGMAYLANPMPGDTDFDSQVDFDDLLTLAQNYSTNPDASWFDGDFNRDRVVDFDDLLALAQHYGSGSLASTTDFDRDWERARLVIPEPASITLIGTAFAVRRRREPSAR